MNKLLGIVSKYKLLIAISFLFGITLLGIFNWQEERSRFYLFVKFVESGPLYKGMPVCYKGYEIGKTEKVTLNGDYKYTLVKIAIFPQNPKLPKGVDAVVKKHDLLGNYIDLVAPEEHSGKLLKNGAIISGTPLFDMGTFLAEIDNSGLLIPLIQNFSDAALSLSQTSLKIGDFFSDSRTILKDNRQNLKHTTDSLNKMTSNFNTSFSKDKLDKTTSGVEKSTTNIQAITENVKNITQSVDCATRTLDKTIEKLDGTLSNTKAITGGIKDVMRKRFAGLRIIFGKPIEKCSRDF